MEIEDDKLYRLHEVIGIGTDCTTGPGLLVGSELRKAIERCELKIENVKFECVE